MNDALPTAEEGPLRTNISFPQVSGREEVKASNRKAINKKSKYLCATLGLARSLVHRLPRYITPITPVPKTGDPEFNRRAAEYFHHWADSPMLADVHQVRDYWRIQQTVVRNMFRAGDVFPHYVRRDESIPPAVQLFDDTQIDGTYAEGFTNERAARTMDGIEYDAVGAPRNYLLKLKGEKVRLLPREQVAHAFDPERISQGRGLSWLYAGTNSCVDMLDLVTLEKGAVKLHGALAAVIKKKSGTDDGKGLTGRLRDLANTMQLSTTDTTPCEEESAASESKLIDEIQGIMVKYLGTDEEAQLLNSSRPSPTWVGFMDFLVREIAWSFGVSPEFVWSLAGLNGPNSRVILQDSDVFFKDVTGLVAIHETRRTYHKVIAHGMVRWDESSGSEGLRPPLAAHRAGWHRVEFRGPASVSIDNKNDTQADVMRVGKGMLAIDDYWHRRNRDPRVQRTRQIDWLAEAMAECESKGVPFEYFYSLTPGTPGLPALGASGTDDSTNAPPDDQNPEDE